MTAVELILSKLPDARQAGKGWSARCPAHEDRRASLNIALGDNGGAIVHCHAGCEPAAVVSAVGLTLADLMPERTESSVDKGKSHRKAKAKGKAQTPRKVTTNGEPRIVATYSYRDETGSMLLQVVRLEPKDFRQRKPKAGGGWDWSVAGVRAVPYRRPQLLAEPKRPVVVVEGEKDADNLARIGVLATCNAGGAGKWTTAHAEFLRGRCVIVLPDNDEAGRNHVLQVARLLHGIAESVRIVELPGLLAKGDVSDWLAAGGTKEELKRLAEAAPLLDANSGAAE